MLIRLRGCAGWSAPLLFTYCINSFSHDMAQLMIIVPKKTKALTSPSRSSLMFSWHCRIWIFWFFVCLCWGLTSQSTIFQSYRDGATASWVINQYFRGVKCLAQGHNTAAVGFEPPTSRSGVRHFTTEPPRSPEYFGIYCGTFNQNNHIYYIAINNKHLKMCDKSWGASVRISLDIGTLTRYRHTYSDASACCLCMTLL